MSGYPSGEQLRARFLKVLGDIIKGDADKTPSDTGLDDETVAALDAVATDKSKTAINNAQTEFAKMLDGTHYRQHRAADREFFARQAQEKGT